MAKTLDAAGVKRLIQEIKGANKNLNTPIPISTENTTESMAQNVRNIADYVEKAKAAGVANVNGMAVTCIIDDEYSGVGYLYSYNGGPIWVTGIITYDDTAVSPTAFFVDNEGLYNKRDVVIKDLSDQVTSDMLVEGARKPIILTPSTTEVDEETYQKLLSDDVDVVFKDDGWYIPITVKGLTDPDAITLEFSLTLFDGAALDTFDSVLIDVQIGIAKNSPHRVTFYYNETSDLDTILQTSGYFNKSTLAPVLQEIDLTGTDAERKAKLDQFEADWKALTDASDLAGARFVGQITTPKGGYASVLFTYNIGIDTFTGVTNLDDSDYRNHYSVYLNSIGELHITPLFSHLEAITIKTDNKPESKAANVAAIKAYVDNLKLLGVDTTNGYMIPAKLDAGNLDGFVSYHSDTADYPWSGIFIKPGGSGRFVGINKDGLVVSIPDILISGNIYTTLTTTSKGIIPAINEINANAVHSDKLVPTLEAITIRTGNTPESMAANIAAIKTYVDNLKALGVDVTKGYMIPCKFPNSVAGVLSAASNSLIVAITTNGRDELNCYEVYIGGDNPGAVYSIGGFQLKISSALTTTSKQIVGAINEVNALAKGYSTIFTPIELTTETAQNKTAIDARVAAFTAQGISLTNGCCIPVTYKGVYAGNISLVNGDWYGLLVKNTNNPADNINIKLSADGTITEGNSAQ